MPLIGTDELGNPYSIVINSANGSIIVAPAPGLTPSTADNSVSARALDLIASALRLIGVQASGESVDIAAANDSLMVLDQMIDGWNADGLAIFTTSASDYALVPSKQSYTLGPGGDWNANRPAQINSMSAILLSNPSNPLEFPLTMYSVDEWQTKVPVKTVNGSFPLICYDDGGFPLRTLSFWPIPQQAHHVRVYAWQGLGVPSLLTTVLAFPPGYAEAFRYNLAVRLSAEFAQSIPATVAAIAAESMARLRTINAPLLTLRSDLTSGGSNYRAEWFGIP